MTNLSRPYVVDESNWKSSFSVDVLPWCASEAHNYHLPYATDNIQVERVAIKAAKLAWEKERDFLKNYMPQMGMTCMNKWFFTGRLDLTNATKTI